MTLWEIYKVSRATWFRHKSKVKFTVPEQRVLELLIEKDRVTAPEARQRIYGKLAEKRSDHTVRNIIGQLRKKLRYWDIRIVTWYGWGYILKDKPKAEYLLEKLR